MPKPGRREPLVSHDEAAVYLGTTRQGLYNMRHKGAAPPAYKVGRLVKYRLSEIDEWLAERHIDGGPAAP